MRNIADRVGSEDFEWVAEAVEIQRDSGGDLAELLDNVPTAIRDRRRINRQIKSLTAEGRLSTMILFALPIIMFVFMAFANRTSFETLTCSPRSRSRPFRSPSGRCGVFTSSCRRVGARSCAPTSASRALRSPICARSCSPSARAIASCNSPEPATFFVPDLILEARGHERQKDIERAFPGVLDQLSICVEAGLGLDAALDRAARSGKGRLAEELSRVMQDVQLGGSRQVALESMVKRTDVADIRHFVVALGQANRYGVPVVQSLRAQVLEAREQRRGLRRQPLRYGRVMISRRCPSGSSK